MVEELLDKVRDLPKRTQRIVLGLGMVVSVTSLMSGLVEWDDAARPGFIGGLMAMLLKDAINYLLGNKKEVKDVQRRDLTGGGG